MRFYSTMHPTTLLMRAKTRLLEEGYKHAEIPDWDLSTHWIGERVQHMAPGHAVTGYYRGELSFYVYDDGGTVLTENPVIHSPYRRNTGHHGGSSEDYIYAASFDQWGLMLGAMCDVSHEADVDGVIGLRLVGAYDCLGERAVRHSDGTPFSSSRGVFTAVTVKEFTALSRENHGVDVSCAVHRWSPHPSGVSTCRKCGRAHRFDFSRGSW